MKTIYYLFTWLLICTIASCGVDRPPFIELEERKPIENNDDDEEEDEDEEEGPPKERSAGLVHQKGFPLETLLVVSGGNLSSEEQVLLSTLQGVVSKTSPVQIYIDEGGPSSVWREYLGSAYNITIMRNITLDDVLRKFINEEKIEGYILYDRSQNKRSLTAATSLCGALNAVAVDKSIESEIVSNYDLPLLADVSDKNEKWIWEEYSDIFSKSIVAEMSPDINHHLRDYIALTDAFAFYDGITQWRGGVLGVLEPGAYCFGYGDNEFNMVAAASGLGVSTLPTDMAANLTTLSSIYNTDGLKQRDAVKEGETEEGVHYAAFLVSDGDNIAYNMWSQQQYFSSRSRGNFGVGYTITSSLYDLAPPVLRWYYENSTENDYFVCGPSGSSYIFPSRMPEDALDDYVVKLNEFASHTGLTICNILDQKAINRMDVWEKYLSQPNIDALIYTGYGESPNGTIQFSSNGKPIIEQRDNLWENLQEEESVINNLNSRPADPYSVEGYSLVFVHTWTKELSDIQYVVDRLESHVRVVTPDVFVKLIQQNLNK